jgi:hypothetical protein
LYNWWSKQRKQRLTDPRMAHGRAGARHARHQRTSFAAVGTCGAPTSRLVVVGVVVDGGGGVVVVVAAAAAARRLLSPRAAVDTGPRFEGTPRWHSARPVVELVDSCPRTSRQSWHHRQ